MGWVAVVTRILDGVMDAINISKKKKYADDAASTIANGDGVRKSESSFADLADKSGSDRAE